MTVSAVAEHKGIAVADFSVEIERKTISSSSLQTTFVVDVKLPVGLTGREKTIIFNAAKKCDVTKMLEGEMSFSYQLLEES